MNVQADGPSTVVLALTKPLAPGYLLTPFGWAAQPLAAMIQTDPALVTQLFELDRPRMHVIALALAHVDDNPAPNLAPVLFHASFREVLQRVTGQAHVEFKGVLRRLPSAVLSRQGYLRLIELLDDPLCAKVLHHLEQRKITDSIVSILYEATAVLRPVLAELLRVIESTEKLDHLQDGLLRCGIRSGRWCREPQGPCANGRRFVRSVQRQRNPGLRADFCNKIGPSLPFAAAHQFDRCWG